MTPMKTRACLSLVLMLAAPSRLSAHPGPIPEGMMIKYSTPEVRVWTDIGKKNAEKVIERICFYGERIDAFFASFGIRSRKSNPIRCYLYADMHDFRERRRKENVWTGAGAYFSVNNNRIVAGYGEGARDAMSTLMHECGHQIIRRYISDPPPWLDEGLACYFQGFEFDAHGNRVSTCNEFSRFAHLKSMIAKNNLLDWKTLLAEVDGGLWGERLRRGEVDSPRFYSQSWGVVFFYLHADAEAVNVLWAKFLKGMHTGRERTKLIANDLMNRQEGFRAFFDRVDEREIFLAFKKAEKLRAQNQYDPALEALLTILEFRPEHRAALRLAADASWDGRRFDASLEFWRILKGLDPRNALYEWKSCRCLMEAGLKNNDSALLLEAVEAGKKAVRMTKKQDPHGLAALAMALHATGKLKDALSTMRKATRFKSENREEYLRLEKHYAKEVIAAQKKR